MVRLATDSDTTYRPYVPTNAQLLSYKDNGVLGAKNFLPSNAVSDTKNGVTFTVNADMSITISTGSGGATANSIVGINAAYKPPKGTYKLSSGILDNKFYLTMDAYNGNTWVKGIGNTASGDAVFTIDYVGYDTIRVYVAVLSGAVYTTAKTIYPMITLPSDTDPTYQPYAMTNKELTDLATTIATNEKTATSTNATYKYNEYTYGRVHQVYVEITPTATTDVSNIEEVTLNLEHKPLVDSVAAMTSLTASASDRSVKTMAFISSAGKLNIWGAMTSGRGGRAIFTYIF